MVQVCEITEALTVYFMSMRKKTFLFTFSVLPSLSSIESFIKVCFSIVFWVIYVVVLLPVLRHSLLTAFLEFLQRKCTLKIRQKPKR